MLSSKIVLATDDGFGNTITTYELTYPVRIHNELMTHRVFSRNAGSSRAIPSAQTIQDVRDNPASFPVWYKNTSGMSARIEAGPDDQKALNDHWASAVRFSTLLAERMQYLNVHKEHINRLLAPFQHITVIVTSTEWLNFFQLRTAPDAQPEFRKLALMMLDQYVNGDVIGGDWHMPYVDPTDLSLSDYEDKTTTFYQAIRSSVARCARVSYNRQNVLASAVVDNRLFDLLGSSGHMSPFEHVAHTVDQQHTKEYERNYRHWVSLRAFGEPLGYHPYPEVTVGSNNPDHGQFWHIEELYYQLRERGVYNDR